MSCYNGMTMSCHLCQCMAMQQNASLHSIIHTLQIPFQDYLPWQVGSLLFQVWLAEHVLVVDPNRSKLLPQENMANMPTPYSPFGRAAGSYEMSPSAGAVNEGQVAMHEKI